MPYAPKSLCVVTGCPNMVPHGRCEDHRLEARRESDRKRPSASARGYTYKWAQHARDYLRRHRECMSVECVQLPWWSRPAATDVDHLDGHGPNGPRGYDDTNLQALCHACHSKKTATQDGGFGRGKGPDIATADLA